MSITVLFEVSKMSMAQYDKVIEDLEAAGQGKPRGRQYHVASANGSGWQVVDVWESQEALGKFAQVLMPVMAKNGVDPLPEPKVLATHNIVKG